MAHIRHPAVAGTFYSANRDELARRVSRFLDQATSDGAVPKAVIAPHAGYMYSGPVAATAYRLLSPARGTVRRVVLIGPSHQIPLRGLALPRAELFATPLGNVPVDREVCARASELPQVSMTDTPHAVEHSLEVHLPFLQQVLGEFTLIPLVVGEASPEEVSEVLAAVWDGPETLIVVSTDLSHYLDYDTARERDARTASAIEALRFEELGPGDACGCNAVAGLLHLARRQGFEVECLDLRSSGDTAGPRDQVVGYGAFAVREDPR